MTHTHFQRRVLPHAATAAAAAATATATAAATVTYRCCCHRGQRSGHLQQWGEAPAQERGHDEGRAGVVRRVDGGGSGGRRLPPAPPRRQGGLHLLEHADKRGALTHAPE